MNKFKLFIENFLVYGLGGIISRIIPLIMVPIVTRLIPSSVYYGLSDLSNTLVSFACALAIMGMYDAMYRMFFEKEDDEYKKKICSTAVIFTLFTSVVVCLLLIILRKQIAQCFFGDAKYVYMVYLSAMATLVGATNSIISAPTRMQNKRKVFLVTNTVSPIFSYAISIPLLLAGYYTIALPLATIVSGITMELAFWIMNKEWFSLRRFDMNLLKQLLVISIPLLPNFLIYWLFNSCDKVMITNMIGIGAAGIYSVGSKLGQASQLIYTAFAGGWQYFVFSTMKEDNQVKSNSMVFEYLGIVSFVATAFVCALAYPLVKILFTEQYVSGYVVVPYLFLAPLMQMLFQVAASQFLVIKKTWPNMFILGVGALINILVNYMLIPILGIEGASIATFLGYVVSDIICVIVLCKSKQMIISKKFIFVACLLSVYAISWRLFFSSCFIVGAISASIFFGVVLIMYKGDLCRLLKKLRKER